jgi:hypothetical protein
MIYRGRIDRGHLTLDNPRQLAEWDGREVEVEITHWRVGRSSQQNRYSVIEAIKETQGHSISKQQAAEFCKRAFLGVDRIANIEVSRSSSSLNTVEFADYMGQIGHWAWSFANVVIPPPSYR